MFSLHHSLHLNGYHCVTGVENQVACCDNTYANNTSKSWIFFGQHNVLVLVSPRLGCSIISAFVALLASMAALNKLLRGQGREVVNNIK